MAYFTIEGYNSYSGCDITVTASLPPINGEIINKYYTLGSLQTLSISTHQDKRPVRSLGVINAKDYVMGPRTIAGSMVFAVFNKHFATEIMQDLGAEGANVVLPDEIPALNITVNFANEYGRMSRMAIYGVKILNEGQVMSINDLYTENTYQFVALGLEPLNINISTGGDYEINKGTLPEYTDANVNFDEQTGAPTIDTVNARDRGLAYGYVGNDLVVLDTTNSTEALLKDKNFMNNSGSNISEQIQNNSQINKDSIFGLEMLDKYNPIVLSVSVEQPRSINDSGFAVFTLTPEQSSGTIYVYPTNSKDIMKEYSILVGFKRNLILTLPVGNYQAQYISSNSETSNTVYFSIDKYVESQSIEFQDYYPIIEKVTNNYIIVTNSNYSHDTIVYFEEGKEAKTAKLNKNYTKLPDLNPDTEYKIYTTNGSNNTNSRSEIVTVKTYKEKDQEVIMLNDFVGTNRNLLLKLDGNKEIISEDYDKYNTLVDMVLDLPDSHEKQELLIYALELTNQLTTSHNSDNEIHITDKIQEDPFLTTISLTDFDAMNIYNNNNGRTTLNTVLKKSDNEIFYAKPNKHYNVYGISQSGNKSVKSSVAICKNSVSMELERYRETGQYKNIDLTDYANKYRFYSYSFVEALAIRDNFFSDINILEPPYIYQEDNEVYADINYLHLTRGITYYLCCSELYSALDYTPKRKIAFTLDTITDSLRLKDFYLGLLPQKQYLFWIEDYNFVKISKPFLYINDAYEEHKDLKRIYKNELYSKILNIEKELTRAYGNKSVIKSIFDFVYSLEPPQKDFNNILISELINSMTNSYYVSNVMTPLYELLKILHNYNSMSNIPEIEINKKDRTITFKELKNSYHICAINYSDFDANIGERIEEGTDMVRYGNEGYTVVYLASYNMIYKTGFILIDNLHNTYKYTSDLEDHIKEVGDK